MAKRQANPSSTSGATRDHYIAGQWCEGEGDSFDAIDPTTGAPSWSGSAAAAIDADRAVDAARLACETWQSTPLDERIAAVQAFARKLGEHRDAMIEAICISTGKPKWEAGTEADAMIGKVELSIAAYHERCATDETVVAGQRGVLRFKPQGVMAVLGPFNLPGHLPNGHIVPALIAGNTIVFKPSEQTPLVGQRMMEVWHEVGLPRGVINMVQGGRDTGVALSQHEAIDGLAFTGSYGAGLALARAFAETPGRILALEMGGNNPLVVDTDHIKDLDAAAYLTVLSAYITAGQRCTCARRLIMTGGIDEDEFIDRLIAWINRLKIGPWQDDPQPFMGPVISRPAADRLLDGQQKLIDLGGDPLVESRLIKGSHAMVTCGLIETSGIADPPDVELFGPLLQLVRVTDLGSAILVASSTDYGLAAGLLSDNPEHFEAFYRGVRAGVVNWNRQTTGASSKLPFGGVGKSGNHRPAGYWAADYCAFPVASLEFDTVTMPDKLSPGITDE